MTEREIADERLHEQCRAVVARVVQRHGWALLDHVEFARRVAAALAAGDAAEPWPAAVNVYCRCLYTACRGDQGPERQELAFTELHRYLYELSFREVADLAPDLRQDAVNETLLRVWQKLENYYKPGAFLAVAALELRNVLRPWWTRKVQPLPLDLIEDQPAPDSTDDPLASALRSELRERVRACFDEVLRRQPRARQQLEAVWLKYIVELDDETISAYLSKPVASVHVLRSRGLSHLRAAPAWQLMAQELLTLAPGMKGEGRGEASPFSDNPT